MEYCGGGDLSQFIHTKRRLPEHMMKKFLQQLAKALEFMRAENITHMDLKPQNILLSSRDRPILKVADFGFAQYLHDDANAKTLRGSPLYMAPEIITQRLYTAKADLWSIGVITYECLFGHAPFASKSFAELEEKIRDTKPIQLPYGVEISDNCRNLLHRLLQRDPETRIDFDEFFTHPFIDLQHMPSPQCLEKAGEIVTKAVKADTDGYYYQAVKLYCHALEYFVPAIHYESDPKKKHAIRLKVKDYMARAEELKNLYTPKEKPVLRKTKSSVDEYEELVQLSRGDTVIEASLQEVVWAEQKLENEGYDGAFQLYENVLEKLINILQAEPKGRKKDLLHIQLEKWMSRAEEIKKYLEVQQMNRVTDNSKVEEQQEQEMTSWLAGSRCILQ
ncbi:serine/threonine-protein kinase ULK3-like [Lineus longissimus]|uniref:serine/threonine-protein kinase ULK3-like n=1 Tax=Lineus longissimus TaxID=88925 RepID=UPI00315C80EA